MGIVKEAVTIVRSLFLFIDFVVYWAIDQLYQLFLMLSQSTVITWEMISEFGDRVYKLLGIFMLFKISFSLISYVVNPDDIDKEGKGVASIAKNVIVSLILVVTTPYIFDAAYEVQNIILKDNIIGRIVMGDSEGGAESGSSLDDETISWVGRKMSFKIFSAFFHPNYDISSLSQACEDKLFAEETKTNFELNGGCKSAIASLTSNMLATSYSDAFQQVSISRLSRTANFASAISKDAEKNDELVFIFQYRFFFSTVCGVVVALLLLNFCFDIAIRSVKLGFLQMIAPVPIISYIDPKQGKDGMFKKWVKQCTSTYLSLFVRLLVIYFVIYLISEVDGKIYNIVTGEEVDNLFVSVFIIMGLLMFAKQLPKLLEDIIPGLKLEGSMGLNNLKSGLGFLGAGVAGLVGGGIGGMAAGLIRGGAGLATGAKPFDAMHNQAKANMNRFQRNMNGITRADIMGARLNSSLGLPGAAGRAEAEKKRLEQQMAPLKNEADVYKKISSYQSSMKDIAKKDFMKNGKYTQLQAELKAAERTGNATKIANAMKNLNEAEDKHMKKFMNDAFDPATSGDAKYAEIQGIKAQLDRTLSANSQLAGIAGRTVNDYTNIYGQLKEVSDAAAVAASGLQVNIDRMQEQISAVTTSAEVTRANAASSLIKK